MRIVFVKTAIYCVLYKNSSKQVEHELKYEIIAMGAPGLEPGNLDLIFSFADIYAKWTGARRSRTFNRYFIRVVLYP